MSSNGSDSSGVFYAFLAGAIVGVGVGILLAPKSGKETREQLGSLAHKAQEKAAPEGGHILVVDDEETILDLLLALLEGGGHKVETACNGRQALEKIRLSDFDVIISDLKMPDMGGQKLYESVSEIKPHLLARMIFSTGDTVNPGTQAFFQKTGNHYLSKPFKLEEVDNLVALVLTEK